MPRDRAADQPPDPFHSINTQPQAVRAASLKMNGRAPTRTTRSRGDLESGVDVVQKENDRPEHNNVYKQPLSNHDHYVQPLGAAKPARENVAPANPAAAPKKSSSKIQPPEV